MILTTYALDLQWLVSKHSNIFRNPRIDITIFVDSRYASLPLYPKPNIRIVPVDLTVHKGTFKITGSYHGKIIIAETDSQLRVCVSTANLIEADYYEKQNAVWYQTFNKGKSTYLDNRHKQICEDFVSTLKEYISQSYKHHAKHLDGRAFDIPKDRIDMSFLDDYDYSDVRVLLIPSILGNIKDQKEKYGHLKVRSWLGQCKNKSPDCTDLLISCSSLGLYSKNWIDDVKKSFGTNCNPQILWPTSEFIRQCGYMHGGSLFYKEQRNTILNSLIHTYECVDRQYLKSPHTKIYMRYNPKNKKIGWWMLTSSNFTKSALGELQKGESQLSMTNFELGVLFIPSLYEEFHNTELYIGVTPLQIKKGDTTSIFVPIPFRLPPIKYDTSDDPWRHDKNHSKQDRYGMQWDQHNFLTINTHNL